MNDPDQLAQQPKQSLRWLWITLSIIGNFLLISCVSCAGYNSLAPTMSAGDTANAYYQAHIPQFGIAFL